MPDFAVRLLHSLPAGGESNVWEKAPKNRSSARDLTLPPVRNSLKFRLIGALRSCQSFIFSIRLQWLTGEQAFFCSKAHRPFADAVYFSVVTVYNRSGAFMMREYFFEFLKAPKLLDRDNIRGVLLG